MALLARINYYCPLGTTIDLSSKALNSPSNKLSIKFDKLRYLKFGILIASIILAFFSVNLWGYFDPLSIFNRALTAVLYPLGTTIDLSSKALNSPSNKLSNQ
jgi:hypothetical protein